MSQILRPNPLRGEGMSVQIQRSSLDSTIQVIYDDISRPFRLYNTRDTNSVEVIKRDKTYRGVLEKDSQEIRDVVILSDPNGKGTVKVNKPDVIISPIGDIRGDKYIKFSQGRSSIFIRYAFTSLRWSPSYFLNYVSNLWHFVMYGVLDSEDKIRGDVTLIPYLGLNVPYPTFSEARSAIPQTESYQAPRSQEVIPPDYSIGEISISKGKTYLPIELPPVDVTEILLLRMQLPLVVRHSLMITSESYLPPGNIVIRSDQLPPIVSILPEVLPELEVYIDMTPSEVIVMDGSMSSDDKSLRLTGRMRNRSDSPFDVYIAATIGRRRVISSDPPYLSLRNGEVMYKLLIPEKSVKDINITIITE